MADCEQGDPVQLRTHLVDEPAHASLASHQRQRHLSRFRSAGCLKQFRELRLASDHRPAAEPTHAAMLTDRHSQAADAIGLVFTVSMCSARLELNDEQNQFIEEVAKALFEG